MCKYTRIAYSPHIWLQMYTRTLRWDGLHSKRNWKDRAGDLQTFRTQLLKCTHCFVSLPTSISQTRKHGSKCLVHCKMGVSRSASTVIAYAMKEYGWNLDRAYDYVKERRTVTKPNPSFMRQLEEYQGILLARWVLKWLSQIFLPLCSLGQGEMAFSAASSQPNLDVSCILKIEISIQFLKNQHKHLKLAWKIRHLIRTKDI